MFDVGGLELVVIMLAIILLFGPKSIPKFMQQVGRGVRQFRKAQEDLTQQIRDISAEAAIQDALSVNSPTPAVTVNPADGIARATTAASATADSSPDQSSITSTPESSTNADPTELRSSQDPTSTTTS